MYLVLFVGVLVLAIAVPITISILKKKSPRQPFLKLNHHKEPTQAPVLEEKVIPKPAVITPEKEVTVAEALQKNGRKLFRTY